MIFLGGTATLCLMASHPCPETFQLARTLRQVSSVAPWILNVYSQNQKVLDGRQRTRAPLPYGPQQASVTHPAHPDRFQSVVTPSTDRNHSSSSALLARVNRFRWPTN